MTQGYICSYCEAAECGDCRAAEEDDDDDRPPRWRVCDDCHSVAACEQCCGRYVDFGSLGTPLRKLPFIHPSLLMLEDACISVASREKGASAAEHIRWRGRVDSVHSMAKSAMGVIGDGEASGPEPGPGARIWVPSARALTTCICVGDDGEVPQEADSNASCASPRLASVAAD